MWNTVYGLYPLIRNHAALQFGFDRPWRGRRHAHSLSSYKIFYNLQYADMRRWCWWGVLKTRLKPPKP